MVLPTPDELLELVDPKNFDKLTSLGGIVGLADKLNSNIDVGLTSATVQSHREIFGTNSLPEPSGKWFYQFVLEALNDKTLIVLMFAALVELTLGVVNLTTAAENLKDSAVLIEGFAVLAAVVIVVLIGSISD
jgi:magnesium-transporting ATPase (P-type)